MAVEVFPVVHVDSPGQAVEQAQLAYSLGADGVYLIDHETPDAENLVNCFNALSEAQPDSFVGLNFLRKPDAFATFHLIRDLKQRGRLLRLPDGLWVDDAWPRHGDTELLRAQYPELTTIAYLGGVAFKRTPRYTGIGDKAAIQAKELASCVDVVTTSGPDTGRPPLPEKIKAMKQAIGEQKLAIASGVSSENLICYASVIDQLLVATSVETEPGSGIFDEVRLRDLIDQAHEA